MPYSYPNNVPRPAKNWTASQQEKCTSVANAVLRDGGSESEAIYACIHAAGKSKKVHISKKVHVRLNLKGE
jgi:uncharacterized protein YdaT